MFSLVSSRAHIKISADDVGCKAALIFNRKIVTNILRYKSCEIHLRNIFKERNVSYYIYRATDNRGLNKKVRLSKKKHSCYAVFLK